MSTARLLYPPLEPYTRGFLPEQDGHSVYYEVSGNPRGQPVLFVHGGPGGGSDPAQRRFFDPHAYRIILFDQRGCGRSRPFASLRANSTWHLVDDMERLRKHLQVSQWQLFGGSWGSTLALAYAQVFPQHVCSLVLRGVFLPRQGELDWFYRRGASAIFPEAWEAFCAPIPPDEQNNLVAAYYRRLIDPNEAIAQRAAQAWVAWEAATSFLHPNAHYVARSQTDTHSLAIARLEAHYFVHRGFFASDEQLIIGAQRLRHIPGVIVQGRYDVVCPMHAAWDLHRAWPNAELRIVGDAGHAAMEPGVLRELIAATDRLRPPYVPSLARKKNEIKK